MMYGFTQGEDGCDVIQVRPRKFICTVATVAEAQAKIEELDAAEVAAKLANPRPRRRTVSAFADIDPQHLTASGRPYRNYSSPCIGDQG